MKAHIRQPLTASQKRTLLEEANRQCIEYEKQHEAEQVCRSLWVLHKYFGFGAKRLNEFYKHYMAETHELVKHYEMKPEDDLWLCMRKLHDAGFTFSEGDD